VFWHPILTRRESASADDPLLGELVVYELFWPYPAEV
jgi:hypothetical protein